MMGLDTLWDIAKILGPGGTVLGFLLWLDERKERRRVQSHVSSLHRENTKRLERILRKLSVPARDAHALITVKSGRKRRRGGA